MPISRFHLVELEDQPWLPGAWRNYATDVLQHMFSYLVDRTVVAEKLGDLLERVPEDEILDLCSGSSGPLLPLARQLEGRLGRDLQVTLTDKFPNLISFEKLCVASEGRASFSRRPVDATDVPRELRGVRTMFAAFHHFRPAEARSILADAVTRRRAIAVFEGGERTLSSISMLALAPLIVFAVTPWIRPFRFARLLWTYILPVTPFLVVWDGVVSCLRTYTTTELHSMVDSIDSDGYCWEIGRAPVRGIPVGTTYLLGWPEPCSSSER